MKLVNQIGTQKNAYLELPNGNTIRVSLTNAEYKNVNYDNLQSKIPANQRRGIFKYAVEEPLFDTPSGMLEIGYYADSGRDWYWFNEDGSVQEISKEYLLNGEITDRTKILWV